VGTRANICIADLRRAALVVLDLDVAQDGNVRHLQVARNGAVPRCVDTSDGADARACCTRGAIRLHVLDRQAIHVEGTWAAVCRAVTAGTQNLAGAGHAAVGINHDGREVTHVHLGADCIVLEELVGLVAIDCQRIKVLISRAVVDGVGAASAVVTRSVLADFIPCDIAQRAVTCQTRNTMTAGTGLDVQIADSCAVLQGNYCRLTFCIAVASRRSGGAQSLAAAIDVLSVNDCA